MTNGERIKLLEEARECINTAIDKIQEAMKGTGEVDRVRKIKILKMLEKPIVADIMFG